MYVETEPRVSLVAGQRFAQRRDVIRITLQNGQALLERVFLAPALLRGRLNTSVAMADLSVPSRTPALSLAGGRGVLETYAPIDHS